MTTTYMRHIKWEPYFTHKQIRLMIILLYSMNTIAYRILWNLQSYIENKFSFVVWHFLKHHRYNLYDISVIHYKVFMNIYLE